MILQDSAVIYEPDEQAIMQAARRDVRAFAPLYERYCPRIFAYCYRRVSNQHDAEDLTSHIFTQALANLGGFRGGSVAAWLFRIAHNVIVNYYRQRRNELSIDHAEYTLTDDTPLPLELLIASEEVQQMAHLLKYLTDEQRNLLALKLAGELSAKEIGEVLGKSSGAVRVEIHRIITFLRTKYTLQEEGQL